MRVENMCTFVGAEYLIANALIALNKKGIEQISFSELNKFGIQVRRICDDEKIDVVFLLSRDAINSAVFNFSDYFTIIDEDDPKIQISKNTEIKNLQERFIGYLPFTVIKILVEQAEKLFFNSIK